MRLKSILIRDLHKNCLEEDWKILTVERHLGVRNNSPNSALLLTKHCDVYEHNNTLSISHLSDALLSRTKTWRAQRKLRYLNLNFKLAARPIIGQNALRVINDVIQEYINSRHSRNRQFFTDFQSVNNLCHCV